MRVFHICSYFIGNKLYTELFKSLSSRRIQQFVYIPVKKYELIGVNAFKDQNVEINYDLILKKYHRLFYLRKINTTRKAILGKELDLKAYDCIHAHTLFSDGGVAYLLNKKLDIPYCVSIRATDINVFFKYFLHLRSFIYKVLLNASKIIFISHAYIKKLKNILPLNILKQVEHKFIVIPNGIHDDYYVAAKPKSFENPIKLLTIASLDKNKNTITILQAVKKLKQEGYSIQLDIAGEGPQKAFLMNFAKNNNISESISFLGHLSRPVLIEIIDRSNIFILVSINETFGISYIESMARGTPLIYTKDQGIDGFFEQGSIGYAVNPVSVDQIIIAIRKIIDNYDDISFNSYSKSKPFNWTSIASTYENIYKAITDDNVICRSSAI